MNDERGETASIAIPSVPAERASQHQTNEILRKVLHIGFGLGAFVLAWIPWWLAALITVAAVLGNWLLLHRLVGKAVARDGRGFDAGIVLYPFMVLCLVLVFRHDLGTAAAIWAIMAFGDGSATIAGRILRGPRLPWNHAKSWSGFLAFLLFGSAGAWAAWTYVGHQMTLLAPLLIISVTVLAAAVGESLPAGVDDNLVVPVVAAFVMWALASATQPFPAVSLDRTTAIWLAVNTILAVAGYLARSVDLSGAIGGFLLGAILILGAGWPLYVALLTFFILGTATTKIGYRKKHAEGLAQEQGGRRGFGHAFANVGVAAVLALAMTLAPRHHAILFLAAVASLATAAADTCASEIGQLLGRRTFLPLSLKPVPRGTEGAISLEGTLAGLLGGFLVATTAMAGYIHVQGTLPDWQRLFVPVAFLSSCAFLGSYIESLVGSWNRRQLVAIPNDTLNFFNTAVGASLAVVFAGVTSVVFWM